MKFFSVATLTTIALMVNNSNASACSDACTRPIQGAMAQQCGNGSNASSSACLCQAYSSLLSCFNSCPDQQSQNEMMNYQSQASNVCNTANQATPVNNQFFNADPNQANGFAPTATAPGLFAATTVGSNLFVSASGTQVVVPFSGMPTNTNVPAIGNLYSTYNLGSISVGYKTATPTYGFRSSNGYSISSAALKTSIAVGISSLLFNLF